MVLEEVMAFSADQKLTIAHRYVLTTMANGKTIHVTLHFRITHIYVNMVNYKRITNLGRSALYRAYSKFSDFKF